MKRFLFLVGLVLTCSGLAWADEPAVVNDPGSAWENFKKVINTVEPSADALYNTQDDDFHAGTSIRLLTLEKVRWLKWLDLRGGWSETKIGYSTVSLALDHLTGQELLKHAHVGWWGGRDFDDHEWATGPLLGAKVEF